MTPPKTRKWQIIHLGVYSSLYIIWENCIQYTTYNVYADERRKYQAEPRRKYINKWCHVLEGQQMKYMYSLLYYISNVFVHHDCTL